MNKITLIDPIKLTFNINNTIFLDLKNDYINIYNKLYKLNKYEKFVLIQELNIGDIFTSYLINGGYNDKRR